MEERNQSYLANEKVGRLMLKYSVPCIISLLVGALYNIVDQIFIANASYLGSYGNAANTVVFPLTVIALAIAVMIGDGCCAFVSLSLGKNEPENAKRSMGNSILLTVASSIVLMIVYLVFSNQIITMFGGTVNEETFLHSKEYFFWITLGIPFYMFGQAMNPVIRADGSETPKLAVCGKEHGRKKSISALLRAFKENAVNPETQIVAITHAGCEAEAAALAEEVKKLGVKDVIIEYYDLCTGAHVGPGTIALFFMGRDRRTSMALTPERMLLKKKAPHVTK